MAGRLTSKEFQFSDENVMGPWMLSKGDSRQEITMKLRSYVASAEPTSIDDVLFYILQCAPQMCRLDIQLSDGEIESLRLFYSDAI